MLKRHGIWASLFLLLLLLTNASAQVDTGKGDNLDTLPITACATSGRVRFTAPHTIVQIRLEIYRDNGEKLFDNESRGGNVMDWLLQDGQAEPLSDGSYLGVVTVKSSSGRISQKLGGITIQNAAAAVHPMDAALLTPQQSQAVGPLEQNASLVVLKEGETPTPTLIAHDGKDAQLTRGRGALIFRLGDFFGGKDTEQMRLTAEGNVGIGITQPQAKLDVDGVIRSSQGIIFPDGSTQYSAASKTLGAKSTAGDQSAAGKNREQPQSTGTGTPGKLVKWTDSSGGQGDSVVTESNGFIGIGTTTPTAPLTVDSSANTLPAGSGSLFVRGNANKERFELRSAGAIPGPAIQGKGYGGTIANPSATQAGSDLMIIGGSGHNGNTGDSGIVLFNAGTIKVTAEENWSPTANGAFIHFETTPPGSPTSARAERMRITGSGNVGIGTNNPLSQLHVRGDNPVRILGDVKTLSGSESVDFFARNSPFSSDMGGMRIQRQPATGNIDTLFFAGAAGFPADEKMRISGRGNVGIGTVAPVARLHVEGSTTSPPLSFIKNTNASGNSGPTLQLVGSGNAAHGVLNVGAINGTGNLATFESNFFQVASIDTNGNLAANNLPGVTFKGCSPVGAGNCTILDAGQSTDFDKITVNVPAPGFLFITASITFYSFSVSGYQDRVQFNLFKCDTDQCGGGVYLIRNTDSIDYAVPNNGDNVSITYSWVLQVDAAGPVTLKTNGTNDDGLNEFFDRIATNFHSLTAIYLPRQY